MNSKLTALGKIYPGSKLIEVSSYEIKTGDNWESSNWCEKCKKMGCKKCGSK